MSDRNAKLVERFLALALDQRFDPLGEILHDQFELVEPASLPYGGVYRGAGGYETFVRALTGVFELTAFDVQFAIAGKDRVALRSDVGFRARTTGREARVPVVELLSVRDGKLARSEVFLQDTALLLQLLG